MTGVFRRLLWPSLMTLPMLIVLLGLGSWQVHRLFWKQALLDQIDRAEAADPVPLPKTPSGGTLSPFMKVSVSGTFLPDETVLYGAEVRTTPTGPAMGARLIEPLRETSGDVILVDRGWVPMARSESIDQPAEPVTVTGYVRSGDSPGWFSARDDPVARRFFTLDPMAIGKAIGLANVRPFVLVALGAGTKPDAVVQHWPDPARSLPKPPNSHLSYAITWYGLAVALLATYVVWAVKDIPRMKNSYAYDRLLKRFERIATISECASVLGWDAATMMPKGGGSARGDQLAVLSGLAHTLMIAPEVEDDLAAAEAMPPGPDNWASANLRLMRHAHSRAVALPTDLVEAQARANSRCEKVWREAKAAADFSMVRPLLSEVVNLVRQQATALGEALDLSPYDALMDGYQRGIGASDVASIFGAYERFLTENLPMAESLQAKREKPVRPPGPFSIAAQEKLCRRVAERLGLDFEHARLDRSAHPFSGGIPSDVRITTRYDTADFSQAIMAVIHETGHALYERGLPVGHARQPVGEAGGMALHESQSLVVEMIACRNDEYLEWLGRSLHAAFGGDAKAYQVENLGRLWRHVERGLIRVDADEMTYPAHVIMRFRLERAMVSGNLAVEDLPGAWNGAIKDLLGITPPDDARGCLQDIHWYDGAFGYFPCYTLGAMAAAQLMATATRHIHGLKTAMGLGDLSPLMNWLHTNVHAQGSLMGFNELLTEATGEPLDPTHFEAHLRARYLS